MKGRLWLSERHRKSLVYQKRYLLLLLAGYQDGERQALTAIAHMGAHASYTARRSVHRFRVAARVVIAVYR